MTKKNIDQENVRKFPLNKFKKKWPFDRELAVDLFSGNRYGRYSSFKQFLISTWLEYERINSEDDESIYDLDDYLSNEKVDSWPVLKYKGFFIKKDILYFKESVNEKTHIYRLNDSYNETIIVEATRFYINTRIQESKGIKKASSTDEEDIRKITVCYAIFDYILFTKYSDSIQKLIEENYFTMYKKEMIFAFYHQFRMINNEEYDYTILVDIEEQTFRKRLKNIFTFSNLPQNESDKLINNSHFEKDICSKQLFLKNFYALLLFRKTYEKVID